MLFAFVAKGESGRIALQSPRNLVGGRSAADDKNNRQDELDFSGQDVVRERIWMREFTFAAEPMTRAMDRMNRIFQ
ncbi:MAG TPA: hypothetical protein VF254_06710, partial [Gammaproteobacteria bacterium]